MDNFELRILEGESIIYFVLIDFREVWFPFQQADNPSVIVTDGEELVTLAKQEFETFWNNPEAEMVLKSKHDMKVAV